jgi:uncharacterized protein
MPINASYEYFEAEKEYLAAKSLEDKIYWLEEMIKKAPKHKSSENFVAELKRRLIKFKEKEEKGRKKSSGRRGIRKEGFQFVLIGKANSGKSMLLGKLTRATPKVAEYGFSTVKPEIGTFFYEGVKAQVVDMPSVGSENFDNSLVHTADCLILVVESFEDLEDLKKISDRGNGGKFVVLNKADRFSVEGLRKMTARMKSKKIDGVIVSAVSEEGLDELRGKMFEVMGMIRVYTKEPGKAKSEKPMVLPLGATVKDVAEEILKGFSKRVKQTRLTGPSGKFPNQIVGLNHELKDLDVVEFHAR